MKYILKLCVVAAFLGASSMPSDAQELKPFIGEGCSWTRGAWQSFQDHSRGSDHHIQVDFPDPYASYGRIAITKHSGASIVWRAVGQFQCSNGASICRAVFDTKGGNTISADMETLSAISGEEYLILTSLAQAIQYSPGLKLDIDNTDKFDVNEVMNTNKFVLVGCSDSAEITAELPGKKTGWSFVDVKNTVRDEHADAAGEILYESGYCQLNSNGLSFQYQPIGRHFLTTKEPILRFYAEFLEEIRDDAIIRVDDQHPDLVILATDDGYLGEFHYIRYSDRLATNLVKGNLLSVKVGKDEVATVSLSGSSKPAREFIRCVKRYR